MYISEIESAYMLLDRCFSALKIRKCDLSTCLRSEWEARHSAIISACANPGTDNEKTWVEHGSEVPLLKINLDLWTRVTLLHI